MAGIETMLIRWKIGSGRELHNIRFSYFSGILFLDIYFLHFWSFHPGGFCNACTSMELGREYFGVYEFGSVNDLAGVVSYPSDVVN